VDWTFVSSAIKKIIFVFHTCVFLHFYDTAIQKIMFFHAFATAPKTSRNTERIGPSKSNDLQAGAPNRPSGSKSLRAGAHLKRPWRQMWKIRDHRAHKKRKPKKAPILIPIWLPFGILLATFGLL
jgi:hypothetical protein